MRPLRGRLRSTVAYVRIRDILGLQEFQPVELLLALVQMASWTPVFAVLGGAQLCALLWGSLKMRAGLSVVSCLLWSMVAVSPLWHREAHHSVAGSLLVAGVAWWLCFRLWLAEPPPSPAPPAPQ